MSTILSLKKNEYTETSGIKDLDRHSQDHRQLVLYSR